MNAAADGRRDANCWFQLLMGALFWGVMLGFCLSACPGIVDFVCSCAQKRTEEPVSVARKRLLSFWRNPRCAKPVGTKATRGRKKPHMKARRSPEGAKP